MSTGPAGSSAPDGTAADPATAAGGVAARAGGDSGNASQKTSVWTGSIFIKEEGGFFIILRALNHYNRRLGRIGESPEIGEAGAVFGSILQAEAGRVIPQLRPLANKMRAALTDPAVLASLEKDIPLMEKAMTCYRSDGRKALERLHPFYAVLAAGDEKLEKDLPVIEEAVRRLRARAVYERVADD